jgi:hypothetical protein
MPTAQRCADLLGTNAAELVDIRRSLLSQLMDKFRKITFPDTPLSFDDGITSCIVTSVGPSEEAIHSDLPYYLAFFKYAVGKLSLNVDIPGLSEDEKEERRRCVFGDHLYLALIPLFVLDCGGSAILWIDIHAYR